MSFQFNYARVSNFITQISTNALMLKICPLSIKKK